MALVRCDFFSEVLEVGTSMTVLLPQPSESQIGVSTRSTGGGEGDGFPVLYLLHGLSDDSTAWQRYTSIERYAAELGLAVVMPQVQRSFYADEAHGARYWTFLSEELPSVVESFFRVSRRREDTFVAGLSMGGYGAFKLALRHPSRFGAAASLSGVLDLGDRIRTMTSEIDPLMWRRVFGDLPFDGSDNDLLALLDEVTDPPPLFQWCGTEDPLYEGNVRFRDACAKRDIPLTSRFSAGAHDWADWDDKIRDVLAWLPLPSVTP
jgi:putative tributyrin esterase